MGNNNKAKILILDIETMATLAHVWSLYDISIPVSMIVHEEYMLCWCAKWLGERNVLSDSIHNYRKEFKRNPRSDKKIAQSLHELMDKADIIITHNGNKFDLKWANELFLKHSLGPVSPYHSIDTLSTSRRYFRSVSHSLQYRLLKLKIGEKLKHEGWPMWIKFASGDRNTKMISYCKEDVRKTETFYVQIRPFIKNHPNLALYADETERICKNCASKRVKKKGFEYTAMGRFQRWVCLECGTNMRGRTNLQPKETKQILVR